METAKVDIRKLQLLNDRINQTIDALNQVRMSVHGLQHTSPQQGISGNPYQTSGVNPFVQPQTGWAQGGGGLSHTSAIPGSFGTSPIQALQALQVLQNQLNQIQQQLTQQVQSPYGQSQGGGLGIGHTSGVEDPNLRLLQDPYTAMRYSQAFPFAQQSFVPTTGY